MKKLLNVYGSWFLVVFLSLAFIACDRDFTSIESDIEGIKNFENNSKSFPVIAFNKKLNPVQTNGLSSNLLGIYNDPIYGKTTANVVSQVVPTSFDFNFGDSPEIDSMGRNASTNGPQINPATRKPVISGSFMR